MTLFGTHTCQELFTSLEAVGINRIQRLPSMDMVRDSLNRVGFKNTHVDYERISIEFKDMWELLAWLKAIGANNLPKESFVGPEALKNAATHYQTHFPYHKGVCATFEIIWVKADG